MKRSPELRNLSDDHHRALVLAKRAAAAGGRTDPAIAREMWRAIRSEFDAHLAAHFAIEETHLLPAVRRARGAELVRRVEVDHAVLRAQAIDGPHDAASLAAFAARLVAHVRFEERVLFPFAERKLSASELRAIAQATGVA